ncbi:MAG: fumarylacetoacetate hydrolase family protein [Rhodospirillaceae bacterium]|nr:fumarylacetoacetate hydrolase family protein [Rhodospirillaceae bacterium]MBT5564805.1 fumarylacetoacetate hydrolase family protein [Rhodospirillaceae bacterium]
MKFVTYASGAGPRVGVIESDGVHDVGFDGDMIAFIEAGAPVNSGIVVEDACLLAPLRPRSMRDFIAFEGHYKKSYERLGLATPDEWYQVPAYYKGMPDTVIGPEAEIPWPSYCDYLDCELELAAVIGREGKDIAVEDAADFIFGYTIWNDVSARDTQKVEMPVGAGPGKAKDWDGSNVMGPCIVTSDEIDGQSLVMTLRVNAETWTEQNSANMHYTFAQMIAHVSQDQTLYPGETLGSGTPPGGCGIELDKQLQPGDVIELDIAGIGILRNTVGARNG